MKYGTFLGEILEAIWKTIAILISQTNIYAKLVFFSLLALSRERETEREGSNYCCTVAVLKYNITYTKQNVILKIIQTS